MREDFKEWKTSNDPDSTFICEDSSLEAIYKVDQEVERKKDKEILEAKKIEYARWIEEKVFEEVDDIGQNKLSTTWVITDKSKEDRIVTKARLVVRGFEEQNPSVRNDSPTCSKEGVRIALACIASKQWQLHSLDVKAAFLQGNPIDRELYVVPPKEFRNANKIWKLCKVAYGLTDASRSWYLRVKDVLLEIGMKMSNFENAVFHYGNEHLEGIIVIHVDDMLFAGEDNFFTNVMAPFKNKFKISKEEHTSFKYVGIDLEQSYDKITLSQKGYIAGMNSNLLDKDKMTDKTRLAEPEEIRIFRQAVGSLGWVTSVTRPEFSFAFCSLGMVQSKPVVSDFIKYEKTVKELKNTIETSIVIQRLDMDSARLVVYSDASLGNLKDSASQIGYIVFMTDKTGRAVPISWVSKKSKRVARSTLTAETLAATDAVDNTMVIKSTIQEVLKIDLPTIELRVDNKSLFDAVRTTNTLSEKRLMIDMSALRQMSERKEVEIKWISAQHQLADVLTKEGSDKRKLMRVIENGKLDMLTVA